MITTRALALLVAATTVVSVAAPALADTASVPVTVVGLGGTRMFAVEDVAGNTLTALNLGTGGSLPFRTRVSDAGLLPTALGGSYDVSAKLSNLYLKTGSGSAQTDYNYNIKVPSSDVRIGFGGAPLSVTGLSLVDAPKVTLTGILDSCATLLGTPIGNLLGLTSGIGGLLQLPANTAVVSLCTTLGGTAKPLTVQVDAGLQTLTSTLTDLTKLPTALSGTTGGTFTKPSFLDGVGAFDTAGAAAAAADVPTSVPLMTGTTATSALNATFAADLLTNLTAKITAALGAGSLTSATGANALTALASIISQLQASATPLLSQLGAVLGLLSTADQSALLNAVFTTVTPLTPLIGELQGITGSSYAFPVMTATPHTPVPGTYGGTMTVTFFQHD